MSEQKADASKSAPQGAQAWMISMDLPARSSEIGPIEIPRVWALVEAKALEAAWRRATQETIEDAEDPQHRIWEWLGQTLDEIFRATRSERFALGVSWQSWLPAPSDPSSPPVGDPRRPRGVASVFVQAWMSEQSSEELERVAREALIRGLRAAMPEEDQGHRAWSVGSGKLERAGTPIDEQERDRMLERMALEWAQAAGEARQLEAQARQAPAAAASKAARL